MKVFIEKHWIKLLFFGVITAYYIIGVAPDMTWVSQSGDSFDYVIGTKNMWAVRPTGYPSYILIGWLFQRLPFNDFWNLGLFSALCSVGSSVFIFLIVRYLVGSPSIVSVDRRMSEGMTFRDSDIPELEGKKRVRKLAPYFASLVYASSFLIWTQSVVPEVYTFFIMLSVMAIYFGLRNKWYWCAAVLAVAIGTHHLLLFVVPPILVYLWWEWKHRRTNINLLLFLGIMALGLLTYLQTILCVEAKETTSGMGSVFGQSLGSIGFVLALPLWETGNRLLEALPITLTGLGVGLIFLFYLEKRKEIVLIGVLALLPYCYYLFSNIPMWIVYAAPAFAFASILVGYGFSRFPYPRYLSPFLLIPILMMCLNLGLYGIGNTVDETPTGAREFYSQLEVIPDGQIFYLSTFGEPWLTSYYYNVENDYRFHFMFEGELKYHYYSYKEYVERQGITLPEDPSKYGTLARNELYYTEWNNELFIQDLVSLNPSKEVYIATKVEGATFEDLAFVIRRY